LQLNGRRFRHYRRGRWWFIQYHNQFNLFNRRYNPDRGPIQTFPYFPIMLD